MLAVTAEANNKALAAHLEQNETSGGLLAGCDVQFGLTPSSRGAPSARLTQLESCFQERIGWEIFYLAQTEDSEEPKSKTTRIAGPPGVAQGFEELLV